MDKSDKTKKDSASFIVKNQHKILRKKFLKINNSKLVWKQALENVSNLRSYSAAMDILSRNWNIEADGFNRLDWARNWILKYFEVKRTKLIRRNPEVKFAELQMSPMPLNEQEEGSRVPLINVLDVGSCNGLLGSDLKSENFKFRTISIDIAPANQNVFYSDFTSIEFDQSESNDIIQSEADPHFYKNIKKFRKNSFDQICFLYVLSYMPDPRLRLDLLINAAKCLKIGGQLLIATPDSANAYKHRKWIQDWFKALEMIGFKKHSYSKEKHFHGLALFKEKEIKNENLNFSEISELLYILHDKHNLNKLENDELNYDSS